MTELDHTPEFPREYVDFAENVMKQFSRAVTTTKLRGFLAMLMEVYTTEVTRTDPALCQKSLAGLQMVRIRIAYECGRDWELKRFAEKAHLLPWLKAIGDSREKCLNYIHYMEALVAYHRFYGGRES